MKIELSFLVINFSRDGETHLCLKSIRDNCKIPHRITLLDNGSLESQIAYNFFKEGLCDDLILKNENDGGSLGEQDLFNFCKTPYAIFVQCDQILNKEIIQETFTRFKQIVDYDSHIRCIDMAGGQAGMNIYSDRAHFINRDFFNAIENKPEWGPGHEGTVENGQHSEGYIQDKFKRMGWRVIHTDHFTDNGKWSIRQIQGNNGISKHSTDSKQLFWVERPNHVGPDGSFPNLTKREWELSVNGEWIDGTIPENWKRDSFTYWN